MRIAQLAPLIEPVPPPKYGGIELVVSNITEELVKRGHKVTLFASGDSKTKARLISICSKALRLDKKTENHWIYHTILIEELFKRANEFDIVHSHLGWEFCPLARFVKPVVVITHHGRFNIPEIEKILVYYKDLNHISISFSQRRHAPFFNFVANVYNGININDFEFSNRPKDYLLFLGRISPEKGIEKAIKIAKKAKEKLIIAAKIDKVDVEYWQSKIKPLVDGKQIEFIGEIDLKGKIELLKSAKALLNPIDWEEPFGLVMPEAMACGTPIIAPKKASVPEIVVDGKTGFVVNSKDIIKESVEAIKKIGQISRRECRKHVEENFTVRKMVDGYEKVYSKILNEKT